MWRKIVDIALIVRSAWFENSDHLLKAHVKILPLYAALLAIFFIVLSMRVGNVRRRLKIAVGDGGNIVLLRAMRVHANFAEYVPICLLLLLMVEGQGAAAWVVHGLGASLLIGRVAHAYGVSQVREKLVFRVIGMSLTWNCILCAAGYLIYAALYI